MVTSASLMTVSVNRVADNHLRIAIDVDGRRDLSPAGCDISFPNCVNIDEHMAGLLAICVQLAFAGLCSPKHCRLPATITGADNLENLRKIFQIVSDARLLANEQIAAIPSHQILLSCQENTVTLPSISNQSLNPHHVLQLCSGGIDSFYAIDRLLQQHQVSLLHVAGMNVTNNQGEFTSTQHIADYFNLKLFTVNCQWQGLVAFAKAFNPQTFAIPPHYNAVPFGRDLLLLTLAGWFASVVSASIIGLANDNETWKVEPQVVQHHDGDACAVRTELASEFSSKHLAHYIQHFLNHELSIVSPLIGTSKYAIVNHLAKYHADFIEKLNPCFWEHWCGQCEKCMCYGLLFAQYEHVKIPFQHDPLATFGAQEFSTEDFERFIGIFKREIGSGL